MINNNDQRLIALRAELAKAGYDGFLIPMSDEYQSEYVPPSAQRLKYITGFTGSAGYAIVLRDKAAFFTDGRYTLQAQQQVAADKFDIRDSSLTTPSTWLVGQLEHPGAKIAYDPWLHTDAAITRLKTALKEVAAELVPVRVNPIDTIWHDRPKAPAQAVVAHDIAYAGQSAADKRTKLAEDLRKKKCSAAIISDTASIAWLLNIRGGDVPNTPLALSFAILHDDARVSWFIAPEKIPANLGQHLGDDIIPCPPDEFARALDKLALADKKIAVDPEQTANWILERLRTAKANLDLSDDPCTLPKACKNPIEIQGMRECHKRDGTALVSFLAWLYKNYPAGNVTELDAEHKLAEFRAKQKLYQGPSFDTIAGAGGHGAIVHYRATAETNRRLKTNEMFLLDSGGQYLDGTTDVTRTIILGNPTDDMRDHFTRVLRGHIALAGIRFPEGITGAELDVLARQYLWSVGLDYNHGTGHGVGSYLGVHEGPQAISRRNTVALKPGMVVSNEPGFYKAGEYGIRIENLQTVITVSERAEGIRAMLGFETLTLVPIDRNLIDTKLLSREDTEWLNAYHAQVYQTHSSAVDSETLEWLKRATAVI
jgi:Xaa-Pro aminopeptidase